MPNMRYAGNRSGEYSQAERTGLIGKVLGPNVNGQYFLVTEAAYDAETDTTYVTAEPILSPETQLRRLQDGVA